MIVVSGDWNMVSLQVPLTDMRHYHTWLAGHSWLEEYGDPEQKWEELRPAAREAAVHVLVCIEDRICFVSEGSRKFLPFVLFVLLSSSLHVIFSSVQQACCFSVLFNNNMFFSPDL